VLNTLGFEKEAMQMFDRLTFIQRFWLARGSGQRLNHHAAEIHRRYSQVDRYLLPMVRQVKNFVKFLSTILLVILYFTYFEKVQDTFQEGIAGSMASFLSAGVDKPIKKPGVKFSDIIVTYMLN
jgi:Trk-type K+ transport system membrane component